ncbi:hypothetical protein CC86DRAFT_459862 [Ophiobolus disseminans]|uniref:Uncharacterized protein n=1 Tax=Ophiobolus disseminans TaxID=1469910 RepID=A0A6A6ZJH7_9PLEO|nr:hypothetical protein CC86DRAFT_459862 [Ophiobolus disseminans]
MDPSVVVSSAPMNSDTTSFLDLPAEIRNWIYEILFRHVDPLLLAYPGGGHVSLHRRIGDRNDDLPVAQGALPSEVTDRDMSLPQDLRPKKLRDCSCTSDWSSSFSSLPASLSRGGIRAVREQVSGHQAIHFRQRLRCIKTICESNGIFVATLCPPNCVHCGYRFRGASFLPWIHCLEIGPLLQAIWSVDHEVHIAFTASSSREDDFLALFHSGTFRPSSQWKDFDTKRLTQLVQASSKDCLTMKKFRHAIGNVAVKRDGSGGAFTFWTPQWPSNLSDARFHGTSDERSFLENARYFSAHETHGLRWVEDKPVRFLDLPHRIRTRIVEDIIRNSNAYKLDLNTKMDFRTLCSVLYIHREMRNTHGGAFLHGSMFTVSMTSRDAYTTFDFAKLRRLMYKPFGIYFEGDYTEDQRFGSAADFALDLHVHVDTVIALKDVRINALPIIVATLLAHGKYEISVTLHTGGLFFGEDGVHMYGNCPEIWIDGYGDVQEVVRAGVHEGYVEDVQGTYYGLRNASLVRTKVIPPHQDLNSLARSMYCYIEWVLSEEEHGLWEREEDD